SISLVSFPDDFCTERIGDALEAVDDEILDIRGKERQERQVAEGRRGVIHGKGPTGQRGRLPFVNASFLGEITMAMRLGGAGTPVCAVTSTMSKGRGFDHRSKPITGGSRWQKHSGARTSVEGGSLAATASDAGYTTRQTRHFR